MSAEKAAAELTLARNSLDEHYRVSDCAFQGLYNDFGIEARKRVNQMIWLLTEIGRLTHSASGAQEILEDLGSQLGAGDITPEEWGERLQSREFQESQKIAVQVTEPLETLTESFYWIGFRARQIIRKLPNLTSFDGKGVRLVRNQLIEHPDRDDSGVLITSFGWGAEIGPVIKAIRDENQVDIWRDRGLFVNATEFALELKKKSEAAIASIVNMAS